MLEFIQPSLTAISSALSILKQGQSLLPDSAEVKTIKADLEALQSQLERSDTQIAQALGYELCKCTFPAQIMLYKKDLDTDVCPTCDNSIKRPRVRISSFGPDYR